MAPQSLHFGGFAGPYKYQAGILQMEDICVKRMIVSEEETVAK